MPAATSRRSGSRLATETSGVLGRAPAAAVVPAARVPACAPGLALAITCPPASMLSMTTTPARAVINLRDMARASFGQPGCRGFVPRHAPLPNPGRGTHGTQKAISRWAAPAVKYLSCHVSSSSRPAQVGAASPVAAVAGSCPFSASRW